METLSFGMIDLEDDLKSEQGKEKQAEVLERLKTLREEVFKTSQKGLSSSEFEKSQAVLKALDCAYDLVLRYPVSGKETTNTQA